MDNRILKILIYLFSGLIVVFLLLILVNYIGSVSGGPSEYAEGGEQNPANAEEMAQQALNTARYGGPVPTASMVPGYRRGLSTSSVNTDGAISIVKEKEFGGVAEKPKDMMSMLNELSGGKKKPEPIALKDSDLDKKISVGRPDKEPGLRVSTMPELGRRPGQEGLTMLSAPVNYKIFKSSETWAAFTSSRKVKAADFDFRSYDLLILVSLSDFPSGIFSVSGVEPGRKETVVRYRVNPLAMAAEAPAAQREAFAMAPVPKGRPVRLEQVP
ncbi:MAG: hypothetical protein ACYC2I_03030 [Elusimicrobiales bacterium]